MPPIKNVLFDLGAVLMNLDYSRTTKAFHALGYKEFENMYTQFKGNQVFDDFETGKISAPAFYNYLREAGPAGIRELQLTAAWNAMLLDFRLGSIEFLRSLSKTHRLYLLSNTNIIHKTALDQNFSEQTGFASLDDFFTGAYYSHRVGLRKPDQAIFQFVLNDAEIVAEETLFIDDLYANIESAQLLGFKTHLLLPGQLIEDLDYS